MALLNRAQPAPTVGAAGTDRWGTLREAARAAAPAVLGYLLVRLAATAILWGWARSEHHSVLTLLGRKWDSLWFLGIIGHGYDHGTPLQSNLAFFPLYPQLVRGADVLSPAGPATTGVLLDWIFALAAAWGIYAVGERLYGQRAGVVLAVLWGAVPHAVVESMAYTESLFTALAAWTLYALLSERWLTSGFLCLLAGLTRPTASALVPVVCLAALLAVVRSPRAWRPWAALLLAPAGWLGYLLWVGLRLHRLDGWFHVQKDGWGSSWDGGRFTVNYARHVLAAPSALDLYAVTFVLLLAVALFVLSLLDRQPWQLLVFSGLLLATSIGGSGYYHSKARFLIAAFPLLMPPAVALAKARTGTAVTVVATMTLVSGYFGGYLLLVWNHSP
ncbi:hypothetical protein SAMN05216251_12965 [Actinacidiphila alni]|uniref:Glycosyltransferase RgtA/B/C/D-like domain-containing protein n=1 Tax=Actinacidiphila alni TaxID=380248 RepID=A0A1I2LNE7_9ACTN|nr:glycosyltransferase family 39 protein [Actinacidiphila alni]SFF79959.1 hypothetical protein SAMN05216251_12965 [Actinacidiphila alni]